ncbi:MAG: DNA-deoxyinosine glycosylase [Candidatus Symbiothrix sp.]|jgi:hypoxanthine-DNA glycosylase|nr:DNA-deoxyinosine glycosylase [Candidatus Symbiothrix sp.]
MEKKDSLKKSFAPVYDAETQMLILGTLPGAKSLAYNEYYGDPRNRFWRIIAEITGHKLPENYTEKTQMLLENKIGLWDVVREANREGSLDSAIKNEEPNDLNSLILSLKNLKAIAFNGKKAAQFYDKYFKRVDGIRYLLLPSSSPANAGIDFAGLCKAWNAVYFPLFNK